MSSSSLPRATAPQRLQQRSSLVSTSRMPHVGHGSPVIGKLAQPEPRCSRISCEAMSKTPCKWQQGRFCIW
eukprot:11739992-Alexandrium_andersonii.AAC.1